MPKGNVFSEICVEKHESNTHHFRKQGSLDSVDFRTFTILENALECDLVFCLHFLAATLLGNLPIFRTLESKCIDISRTYLPTCFNRSMISSRREPT